LAPDCLGLNASAAHRDVAADKSSAIIINRGFASMDACLVINACD
jgi:3-oxoacyl-[acyl-carrier-protein] synthase-1